MTYLGLAKVSSFFSLPNEHTVSSLKINRLCGPNGKITPFEGFEKMNPKLNTITAIKTCLLLMLVLFSFFCSNGGDSKQKAPKTPGHARCVQGDCVNGHGSKVEATGERYEGEWKQGLRHGIGTAHWPDGDLYTGQWMHDHPHGKGVYFKSNGERYEGDWEMGKRQGKGKAQWPDGSYYIGDFRNDRADGRGVFFDTGGVRYEGEFKNGMAHGNGVLITPAGKRTVGNWKEGKPLL